MFVYRVCFISCISHSVIFCSTKIKRPVGTGTVKAVVNVFGARQFHPLLQRSMV